MKQTIRKEFLEGIRTYRFLIIFAVLLFLAISGPIMNKLILPEVLKSQFEGISQDMLDQMTVTTQTESVLGYLNDSFEIGAIVILFTLASLTAGEIRNRTLIFPLCAGKDLVTIISAKFLVYGAFVISAAVISTFINYVYSGLIFGSDLKDMMVVLKCGALQGYYYLYVISFACAIGTFAKKTLNTGLLTLLPAYGTVIFSDILDLNSFTPGGILKGSMNLLPALSSETVSSFVITSALIMLLFLLTLYRMKRIELAVR